MAHPFFDVAIFPWRRPEARPFLEELVAAFPAAAAIDLRYKTAGGAPGDLALNTPPKEIWQAALQNLARIGGLRALCENIAADPNAHAVTRAAVMSVMNAPPGVAMRMFSERQFVLDRENLRDGLNALGDGSTSVLVVRGQRGSGKSYSMNLFIRAAEDSGAKWACLDAPLMQTVDLTIKQVFAKLGSQNSPVKNLANTTFDAWCLSVCADLLAIAEANDLRLWIAIDDLGVDEQGAPRIDPEIRQFWVQAGLCFTSFQYQPRFRLMLIDYPDIELPTGWKKAYVGEESLTDTDVQSKHVAEGLQAWLAAQKKEMLAAEIDKRAADILAAAEAPPPPNPALKCRLERIHDGLTAEIKNLKRGV